MIASREALIVALAGAESGGVAPPRSLVAEAQAIADAACAAWGHVGWRSSDGDPGTCGRAVQP